MRCNTIQFNETDFNDMKARVANSGLRDSAHISAGQLKMLTDEIDRLRAALDVYVCKGCRDGENYCYGYASCKALRYDSEE